MAQVALRLFAKLDQPAAHRVCGRVASGGGGGGALVGGLELTVQALERFGIGQTGCEHRPGDLAPFQHGQVGGRFGRLVGAAHQRHEFLQIGRQTPGGAQGDMGGVGQAVLHAGPIGFELVHHPGVDLVALLADGARRAQCPLPVGEGGLRRHLQGQALLDFGVAVGQRGQHIGIAPCIGDERGRLGDIVRKLLIVVGPSGARGLGGRGRGGGGFGWQGDGF